MLGWTNGLFHKRTLVKIGMTEGEAEKYMETFGKIIQNKEKVNSLIWLYVMSFMSKKLNLIERFK